jgi:hypothetical protein
MHERSTIACILMGTYLGCAKIEPYNKHCKIGKKLTRLKSAVLTLIFAEPTILNNRLSVTFVEILNSTVGIPDPENIAVRIALITCLQAELCVLPVLDSSYWISDFRIHLSKFSIRPLECPTPKTCE